MNDALHHRGPDASGRYSPSPKIHLAHNRLAVMDPCGGAQPMTRQLGGRSATIVYNGELYNTSELKAELTLAGAVFSTSCDTEVLLYAYLYWGNQCPSHLNGIFAFAVYDEQTGTLFAARDRLGVKPLFYTPTSDHGWAIASEIKAFFSAGILSPTLSKEGLWQLLFLAPTLLPGTTVYDSVRQLKPGMSMTLFPDGRMQTDTYWSLTAKACTDSPKQAAEKVRFLLEDAVRRQIVSDVPLCTFLSGGLDSSVLTALTAREYAKEGKQLTTFSFEYANSRENFRTSLFQPRSDDDFAPKLGHILGTDHHILTASDEEVADSLIPAEIFRDLPGQADIDSSLLYYCRQVKKTHTVAISGECADEIFGGYPWFYRSEMLSRGFFPWIHDPYARVSLFRAEKVNPKEGYQRLSDEYHAAILRTPLYEGDDGEMITARRATLLSTEFFMANLLERKDRMSMASALEVRVPFADHRIIEYVYNLPRSITFANGVEKALLREAASDLLPNEFLRRKKSPYPKTYSPGYEQIVRDRLAKQLKRDSPFSMLIDRNKVTELLEGREIGTWFGQLMGRVQLMAWLIQLSDFLDRCNLNL